MSSSNDLGQHRGSLPNNVRPTNTTMTTKRASVASSSQHGQHSSVNMSTSGQARVYRHTGRGTRRSQQVTSNSNMINTQSHSHSHTSGHLSNIQSHVSGSHPSRRDSHSSQTLHNHNNIGTSGHHSHTHSHTHSTHSTHTQQYKLRPKKRTSISK